MVALVALMSPVKVGAQANNLLVEIPKAPEYITRLDERCNYIVDNFWKRANLKSAFSSLERMDETFHQFLAFTPYATADTVHLAISNLIKGVEKADGKNLLPLADIAAKYCYGDTAEYQSDELFFPFVEAVATSKKVKSPQKERYKALYRQLDNCRAGAEVKTLTFTCPDGSQGKLEDIRTPAVLLFFYEPDCIDCRLARARLAADYNLPILVNAGAIKVVAVYPGEPDDEWRADSESFPDGWVVGANPDIDADFIIEHNPEIYYIDSKRKVVARGIRVDNALATFQVIMNNLFNNQAGQDSATEEVEEAKEEVVEPTETPAQ